MKTIAYARVSTKEQERDGYSLDAQKHEFEQYALSKGFTVDEFYVESHSAKKSANRPIFNKIIDIILKAKTPVRLLVHKVDRLARNYKDYGSIEDLIFDKGMELHLVHDRAVLNKNSAPSDFASCGFNLVMGRVYVQNLSSEVKKGMYQKARDGWMPGNVPFGYYNDKNTGTVVVDSEKAQFVKRAFALYATGSYSLALVRDKLHEEGYVYKPHKAKIDKPTLHSMLQNRFYIGQFQMKGEVHPGKHEPLIPLDVYKQVQKAFEQVNRPKVSKDNGFMFGGLITCGRCGCAVTPQMQKKKYIYYHCTNHKGTCKDQPYLRQEALSEQFAEAFKAIQVPAEHIPLIIADLRKGHKDEITYHKQQTENIQRQISKHKDRLNNLLTMRMDGEIDTDTFKTKQNQIQDEVMHLESSLSAHTMANFDYIDRAEKILELAKDAHSLYLSRNGDDRRKLINLVLSNCTLDAGNLRYEYEKPFDLFEKMVSCKEWWAIGDLNTRTSPLSAARSIAPKWFSVIFT